MSTINLTEARQIIAESLLFTSVEEQSHAESLLLRTLNKFFIPQSQAFEYRPQSDRRLILPDQRYGFRSIRDTGKYTTWGSVRLWGFKNPQATFATFEYDQDIIKQFGGHRYEVPASVFSGELNNFSASRELYGDNGNMYLRTHSSLVCVSPQLALAWMLTDYNESNRMARELRKQVFQGHNLRTKLKLGDLMLCR